MSEEIAPSQHDEDSRDTTLAPPWMGQWVQNQSRELEIRAQELKLQERKEDHGFEYSKMSLSAQAEDFKHTRELKHSQFSTGCRYALGAAVVIMFFLGILILTGHEQVALELVKVVAYGGAGVAGGYGWGRLKRGEVSQPPNSDS